MTINKLKKEDLTKYGNLVITVEPSNALVYIDGQQVDVSRIIKATYGLHQIMAKAEGYDTVIQYIRVNENSANISISLDEEKERSASVSDNSVTANKNDTKTYNTSTDSNKKDSVSGNTATGDAASKVKEDKNNTTNTVSGSNISSNGSTTGYKVTIEAPKGAEVYVDGNYVGIIPISFAKKAGNHEITIRKNGYLTRAYTIDVDKENKDISYSFSDLTPIE